MVRSSRLLYFILNKTYRYQVFRFCYRNNSSSSQNSVWESAIGLEIHAQINAKSKLFSSSATFFNAPTNSQVTYFDAALPGCLPVLNRVCVEAGVLTALALNCRVNKVSTFDRKHYFYPDLPAGYQMTQQFYPLASDGYLKFPVFDSHLRNSSYEFCSHIKQLQLEQDSGRSFHVEEQRSFVDLNRAGIGLMEIVFEPNLKNGKEAAALVNELILILRCIGVCTCEMEAGALRVDANISVNRVGEPLGVKTEVKNINSLRFIEKAVDFEINRQINIIEDGGFVSNATRAFDYTSKKTIFMRDKETLQDYRFMPEPNLPPIKIFDDGDSAAIDQEDVINIDRLREKLPALPASQRSKLVNEYGITYVDADRLLNAVGAITIFEEVAPRIKDRSLVVRFLLHFVQYQLNVRKLTFLKCPVTSTQIADIVELLDQRTVTDLTARDLLEMLSNGDARSATEIVKEYNWYQILEGKELEQLCRETIKTYLKVAQKYRKRGKRRHLITLLDGLNEIANNRACPEDAEKTLIWIITGAKENTPQITSKKLQDKGSKETEDS